MSPGVHLSTLVKCCIYVAVNHRVLQPIFTNYNPSAASYIEIILLFYQFPQWAALKYLYKVLTYML